MSKIVILGSNGQLGTELMKLFPQASGLTRGQCDLEQYERLPEQLSPYQPEWIINCAAYTQVDLAEQEPEKADRINHRAVARLAEFAAETNCRLIHISTDYVFGAEQLPQCPRTENDPTGPLGVYGKTKLAGELAVQQIFPEALILRTCGLYGLGGQGNFVKTMLRLAEAGKPLRIVDDQICSPTSASDLAEAIQSAIAKQTTGLFHVVNRGEYSWYQFALEIFRQAGLSPDVTPISTAEFSAPAPRPAYSVLSPEKWEEFSGNPLPETATALAKYLPLLDA